MLSVYRNPFPRSTPKGDNVADRAVCHIGAATAG